MKEREINKASGITPVGVVTAILTFNMCRHDKYTLLSYQWLSLTFFVVNSWNGFVILFSQSGSNGSIVLGLLRRASFRGI